LYGLATEQRRFDYSLVQIITYVGLIMPTFFSPVYVYTI
jgi:hypothetical protein